MSRGSSILLVLALVLLRNQCADAYHDDYDVMNHDNGRDHSVLNGLICGEEGDRCQNYSDCCSGMRCKCLFFDHSCFCRHELVLYGN